MLADDMILCIEKPKNSIRKLLNLISEFSKVAEYKINAQKLLEFLYTNNEKLEGEIKEIKELRNQSQLLFNKKNKLSRNKLSWGDKRTVHRKL